MSTTSPIKNWSHPFKPGGSNLDPLQTLTAMAEASSGFYPIGKNGQWHGGIHFDAHTARVFDQSSVRCIADGEVIAYRIDTTYPQSRYLDERDRPRNAPFSTGFVLVKHRLEAPPLPAGADTPPGLTLYSLYMHLLDWDGYNKPGAPTPPEFISETLYKVKPEKATDNVAGLRVRSAPGGTVLAILAKGSKVKVGEANATDPRWRKLVAILQGRSLPSISGPELGWVFTAEMQPASESDHFLVGESANDEEPTLAPEKGLNVRKTGNGRRNNPKTGLLPLGTTFSLEPGTGAYRKLKAIIEGQNVAPLSPNSVQNIQGYVHFESLQTARATPKLNQVHVLASPQPIKAGDLIGHIGQYQNHDDASPQQMLHLEVFSCEDVPRFITKSRAWAARLPAEQKSLLKVHKGASKLIAHQEGFSASNPPKLSDAGTMVGIDLIIPQILLDKLPADRKLQVSTLIPGSNNPRVTYWWRLENLLADASGNPISGWLAEQEAITTRHSPWEWVGYDFIQETGRPIGKAAYLLDVLRRLTEKERANYRTLVSQEDHGPVRARLYDIIDSNRDNSLTSDEIRIALKRPWHAQSIAQLITRYESEWRLNKEKWDELDPLMGHVPMVDPNHNWVSEKQRIEKLSWWGNLAGKQGISTDGLAWHIQTIGLITSIDSLFDENDIKWLKVPRGQLTFDVEGNDIEDASNPLHIYFSRIAHWPGGVSGVTIGRGYDLGQRPNPEKDLAEAKIPEPLKSWLIGAKGLKGNAARNYLRSATEEIRKSVITRKQQYDLFLPIYEFMKSEVIRISGSSANREEYGSLSWDTTNSKIQDIAVDLIYRGDYTPTTRAYVQKHIVENNLEKLREVISDRSKWSSVPQDRFNKRVEFLR